MKKMGYLSKGYYTICLSPIVSYILGEILRSLHWGTTLAERAQVLLIGEAVPTIGIQICGIALYLVGYMRRESMRMGIVHEIANVILVLWGMWFAFSNLVAYAIATDHPPGVPNHPTAPFYAISVLIGLLWIASGLFFTYLAWRGSKTEH